MKKLALSFFVIGAFILYSLYQKNEADQAVVVMPASNPSSNLPNTPTPSTAPQRGQYKDGQYTGDVVDAFYGNIQVQVSIQNGKITDVQFLQYPNDRQTSIQINQQAMPYLRQEAIQVQNANVDIVGGATDSSQAFRVSLASALGRAK